MATEINRDDFLGISFSHHMEILNKTKDIDTVLFYIHETVMHRWDKYTLRDKLKLKIHETQKGIPNNFVQTIPSSRQALQAVKMFKDEYLLDYINLEDIDAADEDDVDERVVENTIVRNLDLSKTKVSIFANMPLPVVWSAVKATSLRCRCADLFWPCGPCHM